MNFSTLLKFLPFFMCLLIAHTAIAGGETKATPKAKEHFQAGLAHVDDPAGPKYEEAYREFKAAYAESPAYDIAVNVGYCAFFLERDAEALEMYELFLSNATERDISKKKRAQMEKDILSLRAGLVKVKVDVAPPNAVLTDERFASKGANVVNRYPIQNGVAKLGIHPGSHKFTVTADGYAPQSWEFEGGPGSSLVHDFKLVSSASELSGRQLAAPFSSSPAASTIGTAAIRSPDAKSISPMFYIGAVASGVFAVGTVGMGLLTNSKKRDFEAANDGTQYSKAEGLRSDVKTFALISDICLGAAIVSAGATAYFYFAGGSPSAAPSKSGLRLTPVVGKSDAALAVQGTF